MTQTTDVPIKLALFGERRLHGVLIPAVGAARLRALVISPLFEEKRAAHRALFTCGQALAQAGVTVMLPDLSATGNSGGRLGEALLVRWMGDILDAAEYLDEQERGPLCVIGCRAGALLAAQAMRASLMAARFVLLQPVTVGRYYLNQLKTRQMVQNKMTGETPPVIGPHEVEGQEMSPRLFNDLQNLNLPPAPPPCDLQLIQCSFSEKLLNEYVTLTGAWRIDKTHVHKLIHPPFWHAHTPGDYDALAAKVTEVATL